MSVVNGVEIVKAISLVGKVVKMPQVIDFAVTKKGIEVTAQEEGNGSIFFLRWPDALVEYADPIKIGMAPNTLSSAFNRREKVTLGIDGNTLTLKAQRYNSSLLTQTAPSIEIPKAVKGGIDSTPIINLIKAVGGSLYLIGPINGKPIPITIEWSKGLIRASAADSSHAVYVSGPCPADSEYSLVLSPPELSLLSETGGVFELGETAIAARSDNAYLRFQRSSPPDSIIPTSQVEELADAKSDWFCDVSSAELLEGVDNLRSVLDPSNPITISQDDKGLTIRAASGYGKARVKVPVADTSKKPLDDVMVRLDTFTGAVSRYSVARMHRVGNALRVQEMPVKRKDKDAKETKKSDVWRIVSFVSLMA